MTARDKATLKGYFETNDTPSESEFADQIDTFYGDWIDYSAISTINGWSAWNTKKIHYKEVSNLVFVNFELDGTSDDTIANFTVPFTIATISDLQIPIQIYDNGAYAVGIISAGNGGTLINLYPTISGGSWQNSGDKRAYGQFFYEEA